MREKECLDYEYININRIRQDLPVSPDDLIVWSCFIGNDFLPPIPSMEIKESDPEIGALDFLFENYRKPLVNKKSGYLNITEIGRLLTLMRDREQAIMEGRHKDESADDGDYNKRFPNTLWKGSIDQYRIDFMNHKIKQDDEFCIYDPVHCFMKTVQWVYLYYTKGITGWDWFYPYHYSLHADIFVDYIKDRHIISYGFTKSTPSHLDDQLLRVIPFSCKHLLPMHLHDRAERLSEKYTTFKIDKAGKRQEWEAVTIVDFVNLEFD
jgi:5'-3' exoribonuclease 2